MKCCTNEAFIVALIVPYFVCVLVLAFCAVSLAGAFANLLLKIGG